MQKIIGNKVKRNNVTSQSSSKNVVQDKEINSFAHGKRKKIAQYSREKENKDIIPKVVLHIARKEIVQKQEGTARDKQKYVLK